MPLSSPAVPHTAQHQRCRALATHLTTHHRTLQIAAIADRWIAPACHTACLAALCDALIAGKTAEAAVLSTCFGEVLDVLNNPGLNQQFIKLPHAAMQAWLGCAQLCTDTENSVVQALGQWVAANSNSITTEQRKPLFASIRVALLTPHFIKSIKDGAVERYFKEVAGAAAFREALQLRAMDCFREMTRDGERSIFYSELKLTHPQLPAAWATNVPRAGATVAVHAEMGLPADEVAALLAKAAAGQFAAAATLSSAVSCHGFVWQIKLFLTTPREQGTGQGAQQQGQAQGLGQGQGQQPSFNVRAGLCCDVDPCLQSNNSNCRSMCAFLVEAKEHKTNSYTYEKRAGINSVGPAGRPWLDFFGVGPISSVEQLRPFICTDGKIWVRAKVMRAE